MTSKADFNAEEWSTVVEAPLLAGMRVVAAHRGGTIRESFAIAKAYGEARQAQGDSELLDGIVSSPPALDAERLRAAGDIRSISTKRLQEALRLVSEKGSPEEADQYKRFVLEVAQTAAEAHKEGGFVGIGGKPVSDEEQHALDEIRQLLDAPQSAPH